jgi:hypothetical protein
MAQCRAEVRKKVKKEILFEKTPYVYNADERRYGGKFGEDYHKDYGDDFFAERYPWRKERHNPYIEPYIPPFTRTTDANHDRFGNTVPEKVTPPPESHKEPEKTEDKPKEPPHEDTSSSPR